MESAVLGVQLGPLIAVKRFDAVAMAMWARFAESAGKPSPYALLANIGWNGMGIRARAASEQKEKFSRLFETNRSATAEEHYQQDDHFFAFITNTAAAIESLVFSVHAVAVGILGRDLNEAALKRSKGDMIKQVRAAGLVGLADHLEKAIRDGSPLFEYRDTMLHRGRLPRNHFVSLGSDGQRTTLASNPKATPDVWDNSFEFSARCCDQYASWLEGAISCAMDHLDRDLK